MECLSSLFVETARRLITGPRCLLGTAALGGVPFIREARCVPGIELVEITTRNRNLVAEAIAWKPEGRRDKG